MSYLDKTFCASEDCKNDCGRKMTEAERKHLESLETWNQRVSYANFCDCKHEYSRRLAKSGMNFIDICKICGAQKNLVMLIDGRIEIG